MKFMGLVLLSLVSILGLSQRITPTVPGVPPAQATLGDSVIALTGPFKFAPGDSPWVNGEPVWAQPNFDDSLWTVVDLSPQATMGHWIPGWTQRGFADLSGYAWYRLRVKVHDSGQPLWLKMPTDFDDAYQIYANGQYVGQFGRFSRSHVTLYYDRPLSFALPALGPISEVTLAIRFYLSPSTRFVSQDVGGMHAPPGLGLASTVRLLQSGEEDAMLHSFFGDLLIALIFLLVAPLSLWAWLLNRRDSTYLWLFLALACTVVWNIIWTITGLSFALAIGPVILFGGIVAPLTELLWVLFWWRWFGLSKKLWILFLAWALTAASMLTNLCANSPGAGFSFLPASSLPWFNAASTLCVTGIGALLLGILIGGFRRNRIEALLAATPNLLLEFSGLYGYLASKFDLPVRLSPFGLGIDLATITNIFMVLVIGALALRRFVKTRVREELIRNSIAHDLEQAQQLQQRVLVPEAVVSPYFSIEAEYRPAQTVGGDFFQTLTNADGSLLVVIGDVSGKGVSAAMLVAVLAGAIRNQADYSFEPAEMLKMLNRRLLGRSGGLFATCIAVEIRSNGAMLIANAGHLPPYLNEGFLLLRTCASRLMVPAWRRTGHPFAV
jgi:hypothetical protein